MSLDIPEYAGHKCACDVGLAEAEYRVWYKAPVGGTVSLSLLLMKKINDFI